MSSSPARRSRSRPSTNNNSSRSDKPTPPNTASSTLSTTFSGQQQKTRSTIVAAPATPSRSIRRRDSARDITTASPSTSSFGKQPNLNATATSSGSKREKDIVQESSSRNIKLPPRSKVDSAESDESGFEIEADSTSPEKESRRGSKINKSVRRKPLVGTDNNNTNNKPSRSRSARIPIPTLRINSPSPPPINSLCQIPLSPSASKKPKPSYKQKVFYKSGIWSSPSPAAAISTLLISEKQKQERLKARAKISEEKGLKPKKSFEIATLKAYRSTRAAQKQQSQEPKSPLSPITPSLIPTPTNSNQLSTNDNAPSTKRINPIQNHPLTASFPPLPVYWGTRLISGERKDFRLPFDIMSEFREGILEGKKVPGKYMKLRRNIFIDRKPRFSADCTAICHCNPDSGCGPDCINRAMNYLCGKQCPCGDNCTNGSLASRPQKEYKLFWTGDRGFGVQLIEDVKEGEFVMDYRGEIITMNTFYNRIRTVYAGRKDFYALSYDGDEVIDSGLRGNDGRFINHSCDPNIEVRKYQTMGMASEEYEVGFWAARDIMAGEELCYNYNFDSFTTIQRPKNHPDFKEAALERRQRCHCGAGNCSGWLGKAPGEVSPLLENDEDDTEQEEVDGEEAGPETIEEAPHTVEMVMEDLSGMEMEPESTNDSSPAEIPPLKSSRPRQKSAAQLLKQTVGWQAAIRAANRLQGFKASSDATIPGFEGSVSDEAAVSMDIDRPEMEVEEEPVAAAVEEMSEEQTAVEPGRHSSTGSHLDGERIQPNVTTEEPDTTETGPVRRSTRGKGREKAGETVAPKTVEVVESLKASLPHMLKASTPIQPPARVLDDLLADDGGSSPQQEARAAEEALELPALEDLPTTEGFQTYDAGLGEMPGIESDQVGSHLQLDYDFDTAPATSSTEQGQVQATPPTKSSRSAKGRVIQKHRRKTQYGLLWKSDEELEEERRRRKKGDKWLEEQKAAVRRMHEAAERGDKIVPPPENPPLPIKSTTASELKPRKRISARRPPEVIAAEKAAKAARIAHAKAQREASSSLAQIAAGPSSRPATSNAMTALAGPRMQQNVEASESDGSSLSFLEQFVLSANRQAGDSYERQDVLNGGMVLPQIAADAQSVAGPSNPSAVPTAPIAGAKRDRSGKTAPKAAGARSLVPNGNAASRGFKAPPGPHNITVNMVRYDLVQGQAATIFGKYTGESKGSFPVSNAAKNYTAPSRNLLGSRFDQFLSALTSFSRSRMGSSFSTLGLGQCKQNSIRSEVAHPSVSKVVHDGFTPIEASDSDQGAEEYIMDEPGDVFFDAENGDGEGMDGDRDGNDGGEDGGGNAGGGSGAGAPGGSGDGGGGGDDDPDDDDDAPGEIDPDLNDDEEDSEATKKEKGKAMEYEILPETEDLEPLHAEYPDLEDFYHHAEPGPSTEPTHGMSYATKTAGRGVKSRKLHGSKPKAQGYGRPSGKGRSSQSHDDGHGRSGAEGQVEKKTRKKWTLPLDEAAIEAERRKKKKGQSWLQDMLEAAAKKRADLTAQGIPIPEPPPPQIPRSTTLAEANGDELIEPDMINSLSGQDFGEMTAMQAEHSQVEEMQQAEQSQAEDIQILDNLLMPGILPEAHNDPPAALAQEADIVEIKPKIKKPRKPRPPRPPPSEHSGDGASGSQTGEESKNRKPRPARRFKTSLTRLRPKLEAAVGDFSHLTQEEEEAALDGERRRRKKGVAWLEAMKALAKAKRDAREKLEQGLSPDDFVLPPTSLPVSGRRKTKKNLEALAARAAEEASGVLMQVAKSAGGSAAEGHAATNSSSLQPSTSNSLPEIPDFMYPPNHPSRQRKKAPIISSTTNDGYFQASVPDIPLPSYFTESLAAERLAAERIEHAETGSTLQSEVPALIDAVRKHEAVLTNGLMTNQAGRADDNPANDIFAMPAEFSGFDLSALRQFNPQAEMQAAAAASERTEAQEEQQPDVEETNPEPSPTPAEPPATEQSSNAAGPSGGIRYEDLMPFASTPSPSQAAFPHSPSAPRTNARRKRSVSPSLSLNSEGRRRRGPPVKKIASAVQEPLTDEQWEIERKKRKKGHNWVAETKAAAEAERLAQIAKMNDPTVMIKPRTHAFVTAASMNFGVANPRYAHREPTAQEEEEDRMLDAAFGGPARPRDHHRSHQQPQQQPGGIIPYPSSSGMGVEPEHHAEPEEIFAYPSHNPYVDQGPLHSGSYMMHQNEEMGPMGGMEESGGMDSMMQFEIPMLPSFQHPPPAQSMQHQHQGGYHQ